MLLSLSFIFVCNLKLSFQLASIPSSPPSVKLKEITLDWHTPTTGELLRFLSGIQPDRAFVLGRLVLILVKSSLVFQAPSNSLFSFIGEGGRSRTAVCPAYCDNLLRLLTSYRGFWIGSQDLFFHVSKDLSDSVLK